MAVAKPTLSIPTGFETQQQQIASKRKIADAMLAQGLAPDDNMTNWAQVFGHWAQAWAGKSMQRDTDKATGDLNSQILEAYTGKRAAFNEDAKTMTPGQLREKYGNDPFLTEDLKPYDEAFTSGLKNKQELVKDGSVWRMKGDIQSGQAVTPDYNDAVIPDGNGNLTVNPVKVTASVAAQGLPINGYPMSMPMPKPGVPGNYSGLTSAMMNPGAGAQPPAAAPMSAAQGNPLLQKVFTTKLISPEEMQQVQASLGPNGNGALSGLMQQYGIKIGKQIDGKNYYQINGQWYDNPEGK